MSVITFGNVEVEVENYNPENLMGLTSFKVYSYEQLRAMYHRIATCTVDDQELRLFAADMAAAYEVCRYAVDDSMRRIGNSCTASIRDLFAYQWSACETERFRFRLPGGGEVAYDTHSRQLQFAEGEDFFRVCRECGGWHLAHTSIILSYDAVCPSCLQRLLDEDKVIVCEDCGGYERTHWSKVIHYVDGSTKRVCRHCCNNSEAFYCEYHERWESNEFANEYVNGLGRMCSYGAEHYTVHVCDSCGCEFAVRDDQEPPEQELCSSCRERLSDTLNIAKRNRILSYGFKPVTIFRSADGSDSFKDDGKLKIGFELELDGGRNEDQVSKLTHAHYGGFVYCKDDCSLNHGVEFVSQPSDPKYLINEFEWEWLLDNADEVGDLSATHRGGFHMHMNRAFFDYDDMAEAKFIILFDRFYNWLCQVGGRDGEEANHWARRSYQDWEESDFECGEWEDKLYDHKESRYRAVNTTNDYTIELRLFSSNSSAVRLRQMVDIVQAMAHYVCECEVSDCLSVTLGEFKQILSSKSLYSRTAELLG